MSAWRWPAWRLLMLLCVWILGGLVPRAYGTTLAFVVAAGVLACVVVAGVWTWEVSDGRP